MIRRLRSACVGAALVGVLVLAAHVAAQSPKDADTTCPYLRQQRTDRHSRPIADPDMGRDVLDNLKRLKQADNLVELAKALARDGFVMEAMECCNRAAELCPGSPCAQRATDTMRQLALGMDTPTNGSEDAGKAQIREVVVSTLMESCHELMSQGRMHEAAELARMAYACDPERAQADPLIYKMHLLGEVPASQSAGTNEASEPPTCPYCPNMGKPIHEVVPEKTPPTVEYEFEASANANGLRFCAECSRNGNVYHLRFKNGCLTIWHTKDAGITKP